MAERDKRNPKDKIKKLDPIQVPRSKPKEKKKPHRESNYEKGQRTKGKGDNQSTPLQLSWADFIHRVKIHELLRCLEIEQKKLNILRDHSEVTEDLQEGEDEAGTREEDPNTILFMRTLEEEKEIAQALIDEIRTAEQDQEYVSRSALKLLKTKLTITEEQFDQVLALCKDRKEQKQLKLAFLEKKNRERYLHNASERRRMLYDFINSPTFSRIFLILIGVSTLIIILLTFEGVAIRGSFYLLMLDSIIIGIFIVEAGCKISIYKEDYFHNFWNILDLCIIFTHVGDVVVELITRILALDSDLNKTLIFKFLKSLRSLRLLRAIKFLPNLQVIVTTIFQSMLSIGSIAVLMALFILVFAVLGRGLFRIDDPVHFRNIWVSMLTLFQLLTLDDWTDLLLMDKFKKSPIDPIKFLYLFCYIVIEFFVCLNLFVAVLVDNFQLALEEANEGTSGLRVDYSDPKAIGLESEDEEERAWDSDKGHEHGLDLKVEDYFPLDKDSREAKLVNENMKLLASLDFEYYLWLRRNKVIGVVLDTAITARQNAWGLAPVGNMSNDF